MRRWWVVCAVGALTALWAAVAGAHEVRPLIATLETAPDGLALELSLNLEAAMAGIGTDHADTDDAPEAAAYRRLRRLDPGALEAALRADAAAFARSFELRAADGARPFELEAVAVPPVGDPGLARISSLRFAAPGAPPATLRWRYRADLGDSVIRLRRAGAVVASQFVSAGDVSDPIDLAAPQARSAAAVFFDYLEIGFVHIVPLGLDHILFVIGLFLLSNRIGALVTQVTAFTLAHTATLGLAMAGVVSASSSVVEPLIALSIAYVAVENVLTDRVRVWRLGLVFAFGLLHGLGFAGVLTEVGPVDGHFGVSLLAFNVGVELGQLAVIAACLVAVGWTTRYPWRRERVVVPASVVIGLVGLFWFFERALQWETV